jgi:hypothetical protein
MEWRNSVVVGVALVAGLAAGALYMTATRLSGAAVGRYQMTGVPGHAYVLDTSTGQVWEQIAPAGEGTSDPTFKDRK